MIGVEKIKKDLFGDIDTQDMDDRELKQCMVRAIDTLNLVGIKIIRFTLDYEYKGEKWRQKFDKTVQKEVEK